MPVSVFRCGAANRRHQCFRLAMLGTTLCAARAIMVRAMLGIIASRLLIAHRRAPAAATYIRLRQHEISS